MDDANYKFTPGPGDPEVIRRAFEANDGSTVPAVALIGADGGLAASLTVAPLTISSGQSLSPALDLAGSRLSRIVMPAAWTTAALTLQTSYDGSTYNNLYDAYGVEYTIQAAASRAILVPIVDLYGVRYLKLRSGTAGSPVNQGADRTLQLVLFTP